MNAPFAWPGGKRYLKKLLLTLIPEHGAYVEVFAGSAKLLFAKDKSQWEIINDTNDDLVNFFRVAKHRPAELAEMFERECIHASRFRELRHQAPAACELERALRFAYLAWWSFGGKGEHFAGHTIEQLDKMKLPMKKSLTVVRELLLRTSERLADVLIDRRDFVECIRRYDSLRTFFYCDPPYVRFAENGRYQPMEISRHGELFQALARIRGKFLLSYDDCPEVRELARRHRFQVRPVKVLYTLAAKGGPKQVRELLIANYRLVPERE